jgi:hypothetical protein
LAAAGGGNCNRDYGSRGSGKTCVADATVSVIRTAMGNFLLQDVGDAGSPRKAIYCLDNPARGGLFLPAVPLMYCCSRLQDFPRPKNGHSTAPTIFFCF